MSASGIAAPAPQAVCRPFDVGRERRLSFVDSVHCAGESLTTGGPLDGGRHFFTTKGYYPPSPRCITEREMLPAGRSTNRDKPHQPSEPRRGGLSPGGWWKGRRPPSRERKPFIVTPFAHRKSPHRRRCSPSFNAKAAKNPVSPASRGAEAIPAQRERRSRRAYRPRVVREDARRLPPAASGSQGTRHTTVTPFAIRTRGVRGS